MEQRYERDDQKIDWLESENRRLRAELEVSRKREVSPEFLHKLDAVTDERDKTLLQNDAMKELLSQYQSNVHLFKHDANIAPIDCAVEPCPKTTKLILTEKPEKD